MRFPPILRGLALFFEVLGGLCLAVAGAAAGEEIPGLPGVFPVRDLPPSIHEYRDAQPTPSGWILGGSDGVVFQSHPWRSWVGKHGSNMGGVAPLKSGATILAGYGFCSVLSAAGKETLLIPEGSFYTQATDGVTALVASSSRVYAVRETGVVASRSLSEGPLLPYVYYINGKLVLFAPNDGIFEFAGGAFRATRDYPWAEGQEVYCVEFSGSGSGYVAIGTKGFYSSENGVVRSLQPDLRKRLKSRALDGALLFGPQMVLSSYYDGLSGYSSDDETRLWTLPPSEFGGSIYFLRGLDEGMMVGSSAGIFIVPDPSRYVYHKVPVGDFHSVVQTPDGPALAIGSKVYRLDGRPLDFPDGTVSILPFQGGYVVGSVGGRIRLPGGAEYSFADRDVPQMVTLGDGFAVVHGMKLGVFQGGALREVPVPAPANSVAAIDRQLLLGTEEGAFVVSPEGQVVRSFGAGHTVATGMGEHGAVAYDSSGRLFDPTGFVLGTFDFSDLLSAVRWKDSTVLLGRLANGSYSIVELRSSGSVAPLDLPVESPLALAVDRGRLGVIAPGYVLEVADALPLSFPSAAPKVVTPGGSDKLALAPTESTVLLVLPPSRLGPWTHPTYQFRVGTGKWEDASPGDRVAISRMAFGPSVVEVRVSMGGENRVTSFAVMRAYPFWMRWPALLLYVFSVAGAFWGVLRWRTSHLANEALRLQALVDQRTADLKRAQSAREEFFSSLSHELRNPLNGVVGLCDILSEAPPGSIGLRERRLVNTLKGCADQLRSMLTEVLDFSRIDRGDVQLSNEVFDLGAAVEGSVRAVDIGLADSELVLPRDPVWVSGDRGKLRQIITNLASNGLKYGVPQKIRVTVAAEVSREGKLSVQISVSNTGATIAEKDLATMFKGFARGEDAIRRRIPGHGLGLAVSRRMAQAMGGSLAAQSHEGLTIFTLAVVLEISDAPVVVAPTVHKPKLSTALAIEDEPYNRTVLGHILSQLGYSVDWAADGASAMERIRSQAYDLVLTDYLLPDVTGADLAIRILAEAPNPKPPIIAVTAYSTPEKIAELARSGVSHIVSKPISLEKLRTVIMGLSHRSGRRSLDVAVLATRCNFAPILAANGGRKALTSYGLDLQRAWTRLLDALGGDLADAAGSVHEFRSLVLVVEAMEAARLAEQLESAVRLAHFPDIRRLADLLTPIVEDLASKALAEAARMGPTDAGS
jgi:signal transduction histidine kinase/DNA-binding response OmpR family regulator